MADRYAIEQEIGSGGMATVYLAEDLKHHRRVAVKVLRPDLAAALGSERFLREIEIAAQLHHPHVLPLYDSGEAGGFLYYVMPYEAGQSLRDKLAKEGELPIGETVRLLRDVVDALGHAHALGVVHRDIKPENILISGQHALVTDFGVAKAVSEATGREKLTTAGVALGTPAYMAPEQAAADPHIDHRADIYAVGVLAYELLAGRPPFTGATPQMVLSAHVTEAAEPVTRYRATVPSVLAELVMRCLEKRPADRWQGAEELLPQLEALMTPSGGITPTATQPVTATRLLARKRRYVVGAVGVAAVALLLVGGWLVGRGSGAAAGGAVDSRSIAVLPFTSARSDEETEAFTVGIHDDIVTQLSKVGALKVMSRTSVLEYRNTTKNMRQIGEELGVANLLEGGVQRAGNQIRINVQLIDARSDEHLWAETYSREWTVANVFGVQSDIAQQVAHALEATLLPEEMERIQTVPTDHPEAYEAYLRGRTHAERGREREESDLAVRFFEQAVVLDPDFAAAWAALARERIWQYWEWTGFDEEPAARAALDRAIELAPDAAETHYAQGFYYYYGSRDYDRALEHFMAADRIHPGTAEAPWAIGLIRRRQGRWEEALSAWERALQLDPRSAMLVSAVGETYRFMRRYEEAARYLDRTISLAPEMQAAYRERFRTELYIANDSVGARRFLEEHRDRIESGSLHDLRATLAYYQGDLRAAIDIDLQHSPSSFRAIAVSCQLLGETELARAYADSLLSRGRMRLQRVPEHYRSVPYRTVLNPYLDISTAHAVLGDTAEAIAAAQRATELLPVARDAVRGLDAVWNLVRVYALLGYENEVLEQLEYLLSVTSFWTRWQFRHDPLLAYLRGNPRFQRLVGRG
jgi:serine/threonine-protein kinase